MRKFLVKTALIFSLSVLSITAVYVIMSIFSFRFGNLAHEVFYVIEKAGHNSGKTGVILGDSVCAQLWPKEKDSLNFSHLGCNQAITPAGTYILLKKYLANNPQTQEVYYIIRPQSLGNDMNRNYTYQYFVLPFMNKENEQLIDDETRQNIYDKFGKFFVENGYARYFLRNNNLLMMQYVNYVNNYINYVNNNKGYKLYHRISRTTVLYLAKIRELCKENGIKLTVLPCPLSDLEEENYGWEKFNGDVKEYGLEDLLGDFTKSIRYYPADWFFDRVHFKKEILNAHSEDIRASVMNR